MFNKALKIVKVLQINGFDAYYVGGCVRDMIMNIEPKDIDIATNARPDDINKLFRNVKHVGKSFGVTLVNGIEVATFRTEKCYGLSDKNIEVKYADTIIDDLSRRDFSINAIAYDPITGVFVDPFNGYDDITNKVIRFVGNAEDRIYEDPCRILRALRFISVFERFHFADKTVEALRKLSFMVHLVPKERVRLELLKTLECEFMSGFFVHARNINVLKYIFPSLDDTVNVDQNKHHDETIFEHCLTCGLVLPKEKPLLRLAGVLHDVGKIYTKRYNEKINDFQFLGHELVSADVARKELELLTFSTDEINYVVNLIKLHMRIVNNLSPHGIRRLVAKCVKYNVDIDDFIALKGADAQANLKKKNNYIPGHDKVLRKRIDDVMTKEAAFSVRDLKINGNDLIYHFNMNTGPKIGKILNGLFEKVLEDPALNEFETLMSLVKEVV